MSGIEIPEKPTGVGSIIRVVFKDPRDGDYEAFYFGTATGLWVEHGSEVRDEFTWEQMLQIIKYGEAEVFEVVYEGLDPDEMFNGFWTHNKDWIWREAL